MTVDGGTGVARYKLSGHAQSMQSSQLSAICCSYLEKLKSRCSVISLEASHLSCRCRSRYQVVMHSFVSIVCSAIDDEAPAWQMADLESVDLVRVGVQPLQWFTSGYSI